MRERGGARGSRTGRDIAAALLVLLALLLALPARAQTFPAFTGLVTDAANVLPADRKAALEAKLESLQQQTGRQLVVATVPDLGGDDVADYANRLFRAWGVGLKGANNGALLLVAPADRKVRVEVGYGLEPVLTDALSGQIIRDRIVPAFKAGDLPGGIDAGADALIAQLRLPDEEAKAKVAAAEQAFDRTHQRRSGGGGLPLGVIFWVAIVGVILVSNIARGFGGRRRYHGGGGSNWPIWLWAASELFDNDRRGGGGGWGGSGFGGGGGSDGSWGGGGFTGGGGGSSGGGGASGSW